MPVAPFPDRTTRQHRSTLLAMILLGYLPILLVAASVVIGITMSRFGVAWGTVSAIAFLYLFPPLLCRVGALSRADLVGVDRLETRHVLRWWFGLQCQTVFNRIPFLEEALRLVPSAYSMWLRLWGSSVGRLVSWSPQVSIADRQLLVVGDGVVFGAGARLFPHFVSRDGRGAMYIQIAPIRIGAECVVGAFATLGPSIDVPARKVLLGNRIAIEHVVDRRPWDRLERVDSTVSSKAQTDGRSA